MAFQVYQFALNAVRLTERRNYPDLSLEELAWRVHALRARQSQARQVRHDR